MADPDEESNEDLELHPKVSMPELDVDLVCIKTYMELLKELSHIGKEDE